MASSKVKEELEAFIDLANVDYNLRSKAAPVSASTCHQAVQHASMLQSILSVSDQVQATQLESRVLPGPQEAAAGTQVVEGSTVEAPSSATAPASADSDRTTAQPQPPQNDKAIALAAFGLVGSQGLLAFLEGVRGRAAAQVGKKAGQTVNMIKKAKTAACRLISELPNIDKDEQAYRAFMGKESTKLAKQSESMETGIEEALASDTEFAGSQLHKEAQSLAALCKFHVCFFAALTLYRNPAFGRKTKQAINMLGTLKSILVTVSDQESTPLAAPEGVETPNILKTIHVEVCKANIYTVRYLQSNVKTKKRSQYV